MLLRKHLTGNPLVVDLALGRYRTITFTFIELDRIRIGHDVVVLVLVLVLVGRGAVLAGYGTLAGLALAHDDGGVRGHDEGRQRLFRFFDLGGQATGCTALGADALLVLPPEPAEQDEGPDGDDGSARDDGRDYRGFGGVTLYISFYFVFILVVEACMKEKKKKKGMYVSVVVDY
jgi:hypothetical protein